MYINIQMYICVYIDIFALRYWKHHRTRENRWDRY